MAAAGAAPGGGAVCAPPAPASPQSRQPLPAATTAAAAAASPKRGSARPTSAPTLAPLEAPRLRRPSRPVEAALGGGGGAEGFPANPRDVQLHIYHCDSLTGFLNRAVLLQAEIPIYHVGVEVYGREWAFQYFENAWSDPCISGVQCCSPGRACGFEYVKSVNLGPTSLTDGEVVGVVALLRRSWPACGYHITRRNCINFADTFVEQLKVPQPFPSWLKAILEAAANPTADAIVDYTWSMSKWWMLRNQEQAEAGGSGSVLPAGASEASCGNFWLLPTMTSSCTSLVKASG